MVHFRAMLRGSGVKWNLDGAFQSNVKGGLEKKMEARWCIKELFKGNLRGKIVKWKLNGAFKSYVKGACGKMVSRWCI